MKPRTKIERQFAEWAGMLPPLDGRRMEWAVRQFPAEALYYSRRGNNCEFHCMCCGAVVPTLGKWLISDYVTERWTCDECGAECEVLPQYSGGWHHNYDPRTGRTSEPATDEKYFTLADTFRGVQVFRTFSVLRLNGRTTDGQGRPCGTPTEFRCHEIFQIWITEEGREVITSRRYVRSFNHLSWDYGSEWGVGRHNAHCSGYYSWGDVFSLDTVDFLPGPGIIPVLRRNGFRDSFIGRLGVDPAAMALRLLKDNVFEELVKLGQTELALHCMSHPSVRVEDIIRSVRVCTRHGYIIDDAGVWLDYLDDLGFLGLDTRSPKYLCPADLGGAHVAMMRRRERVQKRMDEERQRLEARKMEKTYARQKAPFLGIAFGDGTVFLTVLQTVEDVRQEAEAMHHCVFVNGYYEKRDSVLMSARDAEGNRLETVEIGLKPLRVLQSRGLQNRFTPEHERIVALCEKNFGMFADAIRRRPCTKH